ncbi:hypothetical protein C8T65DRAFT_702950 [Cerioporus squamosus]|nr:hypothetical protein C8T65DRAFT_702950 [Cerioporus squamosus]
MALVPANGPSPLAHLQPCPLCHIGFVLQPQLCNGVTKEEHRNWCAPAMFNRPTTPARTSAGLKIFQGVQRVTEPVFGAQESPVKAFATLASPTQTVSSDYLRTCAVGKHNRGLPHVALPAHVALPLPAHAAPPTPAHTAPPAPAHTAPPVPAAPPSHNAPYPSYVPPYPPHAVPPVTHPVASSSIQTLSATRKGKSKEPSFAISISPAYHGRMQDIDTDARVQTECQTLQSLLTAQSGEVKSVLWWTKDDQEEPKVFEVHCPYHPLWHPKDCIDIVKQFLLDEKPFQWWDWKRYLWVNGSMTSPYCNLSDAGGKLHYHLSGVTRGYGMPNCGVKRTRLFSTDDGHSDIEFVDHDPSLFPSTPRRIRSFGPHGGSVNTPVAACLPPAASFSHSSHGSRVQSRSSSNSSHHYHTPSSSNTTPSHSPSLDLPLFPDDEDQWSPSAPAAPLTLRTSVVTPSTLRQASSASNLYDLSSCPSSPLSSRAVTPSLSACSTLSTHSAHLEHDNSTSAITGSSDRRPSLMFSAALQQASTSASTLDLGPAPRGKHGWPLKYVSDMAIGFAAMQKFQDEYHMPKEVAFEQAFKVSFVRAMFLDNSRAWAAAGLVNGERKWWVDRGRSDAGAYAHQPAHRLTALACETGTLPCRTNMSYVYLHQITGRTSFRPTLSMEPAMEPISSLHEVTASGGGGKSRFQDSRRWRKILRLWIGKPQLHGPGFKIAPGDRDAVLDRIISEEVLVGWKRVRAWLKSGTSPSSVTPESESAGQYQVDLYMLGLVVESLLEVPLVEAGPSSPLSSILSAPAGLESAVIDPALLTPLPGPSMEVPAALGPIAGPLMPSGPAGIPVANALQEEATALQQAQGLAEWDAMFKDIPDTGADGSHVAPRPIAVPQHEAPIEQDTVPMVPDSESDDNSEYGKPGAKLGAYGETLCAALAACEIVQGGGTMLQIDDEYQDSEWSLSPVNTWNVGSDTVLLMEEDISLTPDDPLQEYQEYIAQWEARQKRQSTKMFPSGAAHWPTQDVWHGEGKEGAQVMTILHDLPLRFYCNGNLASVKSTTCLKGLAKSLLLLEGDVYIDVPVDVEDVRFWRCIGALDHQGGIHQEQHSDIELLTHTHWSVQYRIIPAFGVGIPLKRGRSNSDEAAVSAGKCIAVGHSAVLDAKDDVISIANDEEEDLLAEDIENEPIPAPPPAPALPRTWRIAMAPMYDEQSDADVVDVDGAPLEPTHRTAETTGRNAAAVAAAVEHCKVAAACVQNGDHGSDDEDKEIQIVAAPAGEDAKALRDKKLEQDAVLAWLHTYQNGLWNTADFVVDIRHTNQKRTPRSLDELLEHCRGVTMNYDTKKTDDTAAPAGQKKRISAEVVRRFLGRGTVWVLECIECQRIIDGPMGPTLLRALKRIKPAPLGIKSLLKMLHELQRDAQNTAAPAAPPAHPAHHAKAPSGNTHRSAGAGPASKAAANFSLRVPAHGGYRKAAHDSSEYEVEEGDYEEDEY